ncbi:MAG TPA: phospho-N-acetylmuramoyl-pentapeptide-transferase, partial [Chloroflexota bacterium]|nr:phospho-N-acetylmuramoyl-pentapeptide-transferase [Chloroflexota bacterium]
IHIPFAGALTVPPWLYVPAATFLLLCTINGVGITDGMDSLVGTTAGIAFSAFWIIAWHAGEPISATLCGITVGGLLAYLWFNAHPAQMFMGDTGSLALGSLLGMVALMERQPLLLLPIGVIYVANVLSDILQVLSVRLRGKRLFHIAPMHHHFRRMGWPETWVVQRFWITGAVGAVIGLLLAFAGGS